MLAILKTIYNSILNQSSRTFGNEVCHSDCNMNTDMLISVVAVTLAATTTAIAAHRRLRGMGKTKKRRHCRPRYMRAALIRPVSKHNTAWKQLLSCVTPSFFIISLNFDRHSFQNILLPAFELEHPHVNYGNPYRTGPKVAGPNCTVESVDLLELVLWYIKSSGRQYSMCPIFGLAPTSVNVQVDCSMELMKRVVKRADT